MLSNVLLQLGIVCAELSTRRPVFLHKQLPCAAQLMKGVWISMPQSSAAGFNKAPGQIFHRVGVCSSDLLACSELEFVIEVDGIDFAPGLVADAALPSDGPTEGVGDKFGDLACSRVAMLLHSLNPAWIEKLRAKICLQHLVEVTHARSVGIAHIGDKGRRFFAGKLLDGHTETAEILIGMMVGEF